MARRDEERVERETTRRRTGAPRTPLSSGGASGARADDLAGRFESPRYAAEYTAPARAVRSSGGPTGSTVARASPVSGFLGISTANAATGAGAQGPETNPDPLGRLNTTPGASPDPLARLNTEGAVARFMGPSTGPPRRGGTRPADRNVLTNSGVGPRASGPDPDRAAALIDRLIERPGGTMGAARAEQGLDPTGQGFSQQYLNDQMLRAEGNVHLASDATPEERRQARLNRIERDLAGVNLGDDQTFGGLREESARRRDLLGQQGALQAEGLAASQAQAEAARLAQEQGFEAQQSRLDRLAELGLQERKNEGALNLARLKSELGINENEPAIVQEAKFWASALFGGDIQRGADFAKRSKGKTRGQVLADVVTRSTDATNAYGQPLNREERQQLIDSVMGIYDQLNVQMGSRQAAGGDDAATGTQDYSGLWSG